MCFTMHKFQAPHEKLTEEEIKLEISKLLSNHLRFKSKWDDYDWEIHDFLKNQEESIFKLRRHFNPELTTIMRISIAELSDMLGKS